MNNKKRAFMVPVMTLAVCAIAMVGLGFALQTNVTSSENVVENLMIDMSKENSTEFSEAKKPISAVDVNTLLEIGIETDKSGQDITYQVSGGEAFIKIFGNVEVNTFKVSISDTVTKTGDDQVDDAIESMVITIYSSTDDSEITSATILDGEGTFTITENNIKCGVVYKIKITSIEGLTLQNDGTWKDESFSGFVDEHKISYTFTATGGTIDQVDS